MEQLAARRAHNPEVGGSSPSPATNSEVFAKRDVPLKQFYIKDFTRNSKVFFILFIGGLF